MENNLNETNSIEEKEVNETISIEEKEVDEIGTLKKDIKKIRKDLDKLGVDSSINFSSVRSKVAKIQKLADRVDSEKVSKIMDENEERVKTLSSKLQVEIEKNVVVSEVSRMYPHLAMKVIKLLDESDDFWQASGIRERTIRQWVEIIEVGL